MKKSDKFYFFELVDRDGFRTYKVARSIHELYLRFDYDYMLNFISITRRNEVTQAHIDAVNEFLSNQS